MEMETCAHWEGYKSPDDEDGAEDVILEGEQSQAHVGEDEVLSEEVKDFKELQGTFNMGYNFSLEAYEYRTSRCFRSLDLDGEFH